MDCWRKWASIGTAMPSTSGVGKSGKLRLAQLSVQVASLRHRQACWPARRHVGEQGRHLRLRLEVLLARESLDPLRVGQRLALGDADARLVGLVVVGLRRTAPGAWPPPAATAAPPAARRRAHGPRCVARPARCTSMKKRCGNVRARRRAICSARAVSPASRAWPTAPASAPDSASKPPPSSSSQAHLTSACARWVLPVQARASNSHRLQVAGIVLHQQQQAAAVLVAPLGLEPDVAADDRLDARGAAGAVELDRAEQVAQVGDRTAQPARRRAPPPRRRRCAGCRQRRSTRCGCAGGRRAWPHCRERALRIGPPLRS